MANVSTRSSSDGSRTCAEISSSDLSSSDLSSRDLSSRDRWGAGRRPTHTGDRLQGEGWGNGLEEGMGRGGAAAAAASSLPYNLRAMLLVVLLLLLRFGCWRRDIFFLFAGAHTFVLWAHAPLPGGDILFLGKARAPDPGGSMVASGKRGWVGRVEGAICNRNIGGHLGFGSRACGQHSLLSVCFLVTCSAHVCGCSVQERGERTIVYALFVRVRFIHESLL